MYTLPHILLGLGVLSEDRARAIGIRALELFNRDPRPPPVHDELTWELMAPAAPFRIELELFIGGVSRWLCGIIFQMLVAIARFMPSCETVIEEKHGRVSLEIKKKGKVGPTRVSLSNRLRMFERNLAQDAKYLERVVSCMDDTRRLLLDV